VALIMRAAIIIATLAIVIAALIGVSPALADPVYCSTSFQGYRVCQDSQGYRSTEWDRNGMTFGRDSDGRRWSTSRWRDMETTTVERPRQDAR
jgi:hypothetical protein